MEIKIVLMLFFIGNERNPGIATSNDESSDLLSVKFIPVWADINVGDEVITSGMDNIFYEGLRVGKVVEIKDFPEMKIATIQPYAKPLKRDSFTLMKQITTLTIKRRVF